jgi:hypothetical protein
MVSSEAMMSNSPSEDSVGRPQTSLSWTHHFNTGLEDEIMGEYIRRSMSDTYGPCSGLFRIEVVVHSGRTSTEVYNKVEAFQLFGKSLGDCRSFITPTESIDGLCADRERLGGI